MKLSSVVRSAVRTGVVAVLALAPVVFLAPAANAQVSDVYIPPVMKVDLQGKRIDGASWTFSWCTLWDSDLNWQCNSGDDWADRPLIGDTRDGYEQGHNYLSWNLQTMGGVSPKASMVLTVWETAAPDGYVLDSTKQSYSYMCGAWVPGDATVAPLTCDPAALPAGTLPKDGTQPILLTNAHEVPRLHSTPPLLSKVDQDGATLKGARVQGWHCTAWGNDLDWSCEALGTEPTIDPGATPNFLVNELPNRIPATRTMPEDYNAYARIILWESSAPRGYTLSSTMYAVEYACGAWRTIPVTGRTVEAALAAKPATCKSPVLKNNTFRWVNTKIEKPKATPHPDETPAHPSETPTPPVHNSTPAAGQSLPATGLREDGPGGLLAWALGLVLVAASLSVVSRRLTS